MTNKKLTYAHEAVKDPKPALRP